MQRKKKSGWFRPYILNPHNIDKVVSQGPGVYVLGHIGPDKKFQVRHIHSSGNVRRELRSYLGKYPIFMYKPLKHSLEAYKSYQQQALFYR